MVDAGHEGVSLRPAGGDPLQAARGAAVKKNVHNFLRHRIRSYIVSSCVDEEQYGDDHFWCSKGRRARPHVPASHVGQARSISFRRIPGEWHLRMNDRMYVPLNCQEAQGHGGDANLSVHRVGKEMEGSGSRPVPTSWEELLQDAGATAALVEWVDAGAMRRIILRCPDQSDARALEEAWREEFERASDECSVRVPAGVLMQVWSGCLAAAKAISPTNYWIGPISPWFRYNLFRFSVFPECRRNDLYRLGALAAPAFKAWRREPVTRAGISLRTCGDPSFVLWEDDAVLRPRLGFTSWAAGPGRPQPFSRPPSRAALSP